MITNETVIKSLLKVAGVDYKNAMLIPRIYTYAELGNGIELGNQKVIVQKVDILARSNQYIDLTNEFLKIKSINHTWDMTGKLKILQVYRDWSYMWSVEVEEAWLAEKELKLYGNNAAFPLGIALMSLHCLHVVE